MATKEIGRNESKSVRAWTRKLALAYLGAFGMASDGFAKLFAQFVKRGELVEANVRNRVNKNGKEARNLANEFQKEKKAATAKANKTVKKAVKKVEALA